MNRVRALATILLCAVGASAENVYHVAGRVIDVQTGQGIERARVTAEIFDYQTKENSVLVGLTDKEGAFSFRNLPQGTARFWTEKPGYLGGANRVESLVNWTYTRSDPILFSLTRQAVIEGKITDDAGRGVDGQVFLWRQNPQDGHIEPVNSFPGPSAADEFRFYGLEAGTYFVQVGNVFGPDHVSYPTVFYPHAPDLKMAKPIVVQPGQEEHLEFQLSQTRAYQIRGRFTGGVNLGINLRLPGLPSGGGIGMLSVDAKAQTFTISRVPPGVYVLEAIGSRPDNKQSTATKIVTIDDRDVDGLEFNLIPR